MSSSNQCAARMEFHIPRTIQEGHALNQTNDHSLRSPQAKSQAQAVANLPMSAQIAFKNILFATDFSFMTDRALPYAVEIARRFGAKVYAVHVLQPEVFPLVPPSQWPKMAKAEEELRQKSQNELETELQGLPHEFLFPRGDVWQNLARIIQDKQIDLIVLGTRGRSGIEKALVGSVAEEVFRHADCPVLTVGHKVISKATHAAAADLNRILYATDFSPESLAAAPYAISMAKEHRAELILVHAIEKPEPGEVNSAYQTLREVIPLGTWLALKPKYIIEQGTPEAVILDVAAKQNADLIIIGVRSARGPLKVVTHFVPSIAYEVVAKAQCPVLTIRR